MRARSVLITVDPGFDAWVPVEEVIFLRNVRHYVVVIRESPHPPIYGIRDDGQVKGYSPDMEDENVGRR